MCLMRSKFSDNRGPQNKFALGPTKPNFGSAETVIIT